jgi:GTPase SAR1 family protein
MSVFAYFHFCLKLTGAVKEKEISAKISTDGSPISPSEMVENEPGDIKIILLGDSAVGKSKLLER